MELDRFDRELLNLIQADAGKTAEQLAERVGLSPSAIQRRLRRMREQGVIVRDMALVDPAKIGRTTLFVVSVQVERERPELLARFREWLTAQENVQQAYYVTGESDFILIVTASDAEAYDAMMARLVSENPNVQRFTTSVVLSPIKRGLATPVPVGAID